MKKYDRNKPTRTLDDVGHLSTRYNKGLVLSQLRAMFEYSDDMSAIEEANIIYHAWSMSHPDVELRPRFFNVRTCLKLPYDLIILTSAFSSMKVEGRSYEILQMKSGLLIHFGVPVCKTLIDFAGGREIVSRVILLGGINALIKLTHSFIIKVDSIEDKDNLKANVTLLENISKGMLLEGMI